MPSFLPVVAGPAVANSVESFANELISGDKYPSAKIWWGAAGVAVPASAANPFPVTAVIPGNVTINALPTGTNNIGDVDVLTVPADPFGVNGDTASISGSISAKLRAIATTLGINVLSRGTTPSDANTLKTHTTMDASQLGTLVRSSVPVITGGFLYQTVGAGLGGSGAIRLETASGTGAVGDYLEHIVATVTDTVNSHVDLQDGAGAAIHIFPNDVAGGVGTYHVALGILSKNGAWGISTGTGVEVLVTGRWT
jgi:hypothetical protein